MRPIATVAPAPEPGAWRAEDLLSLPNEGDLRRELDEGKLIERSPVGRRPGEIVARLAAALGAAVSARMGSVLVEVGFVLRRGPDTLRGPDLCVLGAERAASAEQEGFVTGAPDLAIEVLSPSDRPGDITRKIRQYLRAGAHAVWLVDPPAAQVQIFQADGADRVLGREEELTAPDLVPGWSLSLRDLFR